MIHSTLIKLKTIPKLLSLLQCLDEIEIEPYYLKKGKNEIARVKDIFVVTVRENDKLINLIKKHERKLK